MKSKIPRHLSIIIAILILCIVLPVAWLEYYHWQYCLFPPSGSNVEVIISACDAPILLGISPNGRHISYRTKTSNGYQAWLLDTVTNERELDTSCGDWWLDNEIRLGGYTETANYPGGFTICDIKDGGKITPQWVKNIPGATTQLADYTEVYSPEIVERFQNAKQVYYISFHQWAVALNPDFKTHPENTYVLTNSDTDPSNSVLKFLKDNQIPYDEIGYPNDGSTLISHNRRFMKPFSTPDGFYTLDGTWIGPVYGNIQGDSTCCSTYGWAYDDSGIYVQGDTIGTSGMFAFPPKAQPIMKLNMPPEYLSSVALQTQESNQHRALMILIIRAVVMILLLIMGIWYFWMRRRKSIFVLGL